MTDKSTHPTKPQRGLKAEPSAEMAERGAPRVLEGVVKSDKMDKTLVVEIARIFPHPLYRKVVRETKKVYVHDPGRKAHTGDRVRIVETRPVSKTKRWKLIEVLES